MGEGLEREGEGGQASNYKFIQGLAQGGEAGAGGHLAEETACLSDCTVPG